MPLRGETIGTAYVRILADGSGLDDSVREQFDDVDMQSLGRKQGTEYDKGFNDALKDSETGETLMRSLERGRGGFDAQGRFAGSQLVEGIKEELKRRFGDEIGDVMGAEIQEGLDRQTLDYSGLRNQLANIGPLVGRATERVANEQNRTLEKMLREQARIMSDIDRQYVDESTSMFRGRQVLLRETLTEFNRRRGEVDGFEREFRASMERIERTIEKTTKESNRDLVAWGNNMRSTFTTIKTNLFDLAKSWQQAGKEAEEAEHKIKNSQSGWDEFAEHLARGFGKGARNDAVNFFGSLVGGLIRLPSLLTAPVGMIGKFASELAGLAKAGQGGAFFSKLITTVGGAGIAFTGLVVILSTVTSALLLTAGAVVALAASLSFALVGAIGVAVAALFPLAAGLGIAIAGFASMDKAAKRAFKGIGDSFKDLGDIAADELFKNAATDAKAFEGVIRGLGPVTRKLAVGMRDVFEGWIDGLQSPAFMNFVDTIGRTMPNMLRSLGDIAANIGGTLANIWIAATPFVQDFLSWLTGVTDEWQRLTSGAIGQDRLTGFLEHVKSSLISVSGFLGNVIELIGEILSSGRQTGDNFFDNMSRAVQGWTDALKADPNILKNFFKDAEKFGNAIGDLVIDFGKLIDALDSDEFRKFATALVTVVGGAIDAVSGPLKALIALFDLLPDKVVQVGLLLGGSLSIWTRFAGGINGANNNLSTFASRIGGAEGKLSSFKGGLLTLAGAAGVGLLIDGLGRTEGAISTFETTLGGAAAGLAVGGPWGAAIGGGVGLLIGLARQAAKTGPKLETVGESAEEAAASAAQANADFETLTGTLNQLTGASTKSTRAFFANKLATDDMQAVLNQMNVTTADAVDALSGEAGAREKLIGTINKQRDEGNKMIQDAITLTKEYSENSVNMNGKQQEAAEKRIRDLNDEGVALVENADKLEDYIGVVEKAGEKQRIVAGASENWKRILKGFPTNVITDFRAGNIPASMAQLRKYADKVNLTPKKIRTLFDVLGIPGSEKKLNKIIKKLQETGRLKPTAKVDVAIDNPMRDIEKLKRNLVDTGKKKTEPKAELDDNPFTKVFKSVTTALTDLDKKTVTPKIDADASDANNVITNLTASLNRIPDETVYIDVKKRGGPATASGGVFFGAQQRTIGEDGAEAVVPLRRPLSQVDPAVRALSAFAQGLPVPGPAGKNTLSQRPIEITVVTPTKNPVAVATETINRLTAVGY